MTKEPRWAYGITTISTRIRDCLPRTLDSLRAAGFDAPVIFADSYTHANFYAHLPLSISLRHPPVQTFGNAVLALWELFLRDHEADRYALFQDDVLACHGLREYLTRCDLPKQTYWNLYTVPQNQELCGNCRGWFKSNQKGRGALGLVFSRQGIKDLIANPELIEHRRTPHGHKNFDGAIKSALVDGLGYVELCHSPSLVDHHGDYSEAGNGMTVGGKPFARAGVFRGEGWDCRELLEAGI